MITTSFFLDLNMLSAKSEKHERVIPHSSHPKNYAKIKNKIYRILHVTSYSAYLKMMKSRNA